MFLLMDFCVPWKTCTVLSKFYLVTTLSFSSSVFCMPRILQGNTGAPKNLSMEAAVAEGAVKVCLVLESVTCLMKTRVTSG